MIRLKNWRKILFQFKSFPNVYYNAPSILAQWKFQPKNEKKTRKTFDIKWKYLIRILLKKCKIITHAHSHTHPPRSLSSYYFFRFFKVKHSFCLKFLFHRSSLSRLFHSTLLFRLIKRCWFAIGFSYIFFCS